MAVPYPPRPKPARPAYRALFQSAEAGFFCPNEVQNVQTGKPRRRPRAYACRQGRRLLPSSRPHRLGDAGRRPRPASAQLALPEAPGRRGLRRALGRGARSRRRAAGRQRPGPHDEPRPERHAEARLPQRPAGGLRPAVRQPPAAVPAEGTPARSLRRSRPCRRQWRRSAGFPARQERRRSAVTITSAATACSAAVMPSAQL